MSFSSDVKQELSQVDPISSCCLHAQAYAMLLFGRSFSFLDISFVTENEAVAQRYSQVVHELCSIKPTINSGTTKKYSVTVSSAKDRAKIMNFFGHDESDIFLRVNRSNIAQDCCFAAFLRGVFLSCGTVSSPEKNYHMEFTVSHKKLCMDLMQIFEELDFSPKYVCRKANHIIYFKVSEKIEDFLTTIGAMNSSLELMGVKMHKDMVNHVNRRVNFENANLNRTVEAAIAQVQAIEKIERKNGLDTLPAPLREIAVLRRDNPEVSLSELAQMVSPPLTRSGVNHRLKRLVEIADQISGE